MIASSFSRECSGEVVEAIMGILSNKSAAAAAEFHKNRRKISNLKSRTIKRGGSFIAFSAAAKGDQAREEL